jgi:two-component system, NarL family, nitrate/nitrite response regulator NarL
MRNTYLTVLIEPNILFREGLARILRAARFRIICAASSYDEALVDAPASANLLLVIGDGGETAAQIRSFKEKYKSGRATVIADAYRRSEVVSAVKAGANAYFIQGTTCEAFIKSLELVMLGETLMPAEILQLVLNSAADEGHQPAVAAVTEAPVLVPVSRAVTPSLSTQERRILNCLVEGDSNKVIARKIDIAEATVKVHVKAILRKIQVHNRTQAAIWAMQNTPDSEFAEASGGKLAFVHPASSDKFNGNGRTA